MVYIFAIYHDRIMSINIAKLFWSGRSQAVRLPKDFRFEGEEVRIRRHGDSVILEPIAKDWAWLEPLSGPVDADFEEAATDHPKSQDHPALDFFE